MTKETLIPKEILLESMMRVIEYQYCYKKSKAYELVHKDKSLLTEEEKAILKSVRANCYSRLRRELVHKSISFWKKFSAGNLEPFLNKFGLAFNCDNINCEVAADNLVRHYIENTVIPALEKELNIYGVRMIPNTKAHSYNCLDFSRARAGKENKA